MYAIVTIATVAIIATIINYCIFLSSPLPFDSHIHYLQWTLNDPIQALLSALAVTFPPDPIEYLICMLETGLYDAERIRPNGKRVIRDLKWLERDNAGNMLMVGMC